MELSRSWIFIEGYNGPYELAMTIDGQINAKFINTGQLNVGGTGQATAINVYDSTGKSKLVWFDNTGIHLASGQQINWSNVTGAPDFQTASQVSSAISSGTSSLYSSVRTLYYCVRTDGSTSARPNLPDKPTTKTNIVTSKVWSQWSTLCCDVDNTLETRQDSKGNPYQNKYRYACFFFMCTEYTKKDNSKSWSDVIEIDNSTATTNITKNTITTSYVNALNITADSVACENLTGSTITGKTFQNSETNPSFKVTSDGSMTAKKGTIGGFTITDTVLQSTRNDGTGIWIYPAGGYSSIFGTLTYGGIGVGSAGPRIFCIGYMHGGNVTIARSYNGWDIDIIRDSAWTSV